MKNEECQCPPKPLFSPGSLASGSRTEEMAHERWEAQHGGHLNAEKARSPHHLVIGPKHWEGKFTLTSVEGAVSPHPHGVVALVNLTPHALLLRSWDRGMPAEIEVPSHGLARMKEDETECASPFALLDFGFGGSVPFPGQMVKLGAVEGLPEEPHCVCWHLTTPEQRMEAEKAGKGRPDEWGPLPDATVWPVLFIVSMPTLMGLGAQGVKRPDVWAPGRPIRDAAGNQVAAMGLRRLAPDDSRRKGGFTPHVGGPGTIAPVGD